MYILEKKLKTDASFISIYLHNLCLYKLKANEVIEFNSVLLV